MSDTHLHIGTAEWRHASWRARFYPSHLPQHAWLQHYAREFNGVELDSSRLTQLDENLAATWCSSVGPDFRFCIQMPRAVTHVRRLRNAEAQVEATLYKAQRLGTQLGACLFSLPPRWHRNLERLEQFLIGLPKEFRYAFEFLDSDWLHPDTFELLRQHNMALALNDHMPTEHSAVTTTDFTYVRLYGPAARSRYTATGLRSWAARLAGWQRHGMAGYVLVQNAPDITAIKNARLLRGFEELQPGLCKRHDNPN